MFEAERLLFRTIPISMYVLRDNVTYKRSPEFIDRRSICPGYETIRSFSSLADFHSRRVPHVRLRAVTAGITMHDVTLGSNPPYLLRATMLQESETLANQVTPTSCSRRWAAPIDGGPFLTPGLDSLFHPCSWNYAAIEKDKRNFSCAKR